MCRIPATDDTKDVQETGKDYIELGQIIIYLWDCESSERIETGEAIVNSNSVGIFHRPKAIELYANA